MRIAKYIQNFLAVIFCVLGAAAQASDLPRTKAENLGFSAERLAYISKFFQNKVDQGEIAGAVTLVSRHGKVVHFGAVGYADLENKKTMKKDNIFRIRSMSKPITAAALMMLYEEGRFQLTDPIAKYIPELEALEVYDSQTKDGELKTVPAKRPPTMQDVMRHTAGFLYAGFADHPVAPLYKSADVLNDNITLSEMVKRLSKLPLAYQPGSEWRYSLSNEMQGYLVEVLSGMTFDAFLRERLFKPLGMKDSGFWVRPKNLDRLAALYEKDENGKLVKSQGVLATKFSSEQKLKSGGGGMVSTAEDYWHYAQMMLNGGELDGVRILSPRTVEYMARDHIAGIDTVAGGYGYGLGFGVVTDAVQFGKPVSEGSFSWSGGCNTFFWVDPKEDIVAIVMTQNSPPLVGVYDDMMTLVYSAMLK